MNRTHARVAAGWLLVLAGAVTLGTAVWLLSATGSDALWWSMLPYAVDSAGETAALSDGSLPGTLLHVGFPTVGVVFLAAGVVQLLGGWSAYNGTGRRRPVAGGVAGVVNPLSLPVAVLALGLVAYARRGNRRDS